MHMFVHAQRREKEKGKEVIHYELTRKPTRK
jgi:hypothetical protein